MAVTKRIGGDYNILSIHQTPNNDDPGRARVFIDTNLVEIDGDLLVAGEATFVEREDVIISDNIITLNAGETGAGVTLTYSGLEVDRGSLLDAKCQWDEINDRWFIDQGDGVPRFILTSTGPTVDPLFNVVEDLTPQLGGDLDVNSFSIVSVSNSNIVLAADGTGEIVAESAITISGTAPTTPAIASEVKIYKDIDDGGGTQLHFENDTSSGELISKDKAVVFALIF